MTVRVEVVVLADIHSCRPSCHGIFRTDLLLGAHMDDGKQHAPGLYALLTRLPLDMDRLLSIEAVADLTSLDRKTIDKMRKVGEFPNGRMSKTGRPRRKVWWKSNVDAWIKATYGGPDDPDDPLPSPQPR